MIQDRIHGIIMRHNGGVKLQTLMEELLVIGDIRSDDEIDEFTRRVC